MKTIAGLVLVVTVSFAVCDRVDAADARPVVTAAAYNYANVPRDVLAEAEREVTHVFGHTGLDVRWVDARTYRAAIRVHLLSAPMTRRTRTAADVLGLATAHSGMVHVLYDRVIEQSQALNVRTSKLLAYVMAHEIGHLLLADRPHGGLGLMRPALDRKVLSRGIPGFTPDESRQILTSNLLSE